MSLSLIMKNLSLTNYPEFINDIVDNYSIQIESKEIEEKFLQKNLSICDINLSNIYIELVFEKLKELITKNSLTEFTLNFHVDEHNSYFLINNQKVFHINDLLYFFQKTEHVIALDKVISCRTCIPDFIKNLLIDLEIKIDNNFLAEDIVIHGKNKEEDIIDTYIHFAFKEIAEILSKKYPTIQEIDYLVDGKKSKFFVNKRMVTSYLEIIDLS